MDRSGSYPLHGTHAVNAATKRRRQYQIEPCEFCGAVPGQRCVSSAGYEYTSFVHYCDTPTEEGEKEMDIERLIEGHYEAIDRLVDKKAQIARFGETDEYDTDAVLVFRRRADSFTPRLYGWAKDDCEFTYAAIKVAQGWWYITGRGAHRYTWEQLRDEHLVNSTEVWYVTEMEQL
jgi:hypothetical protein